MLPANIFFMMFILIIAYMSFLSMCNSFYNKSFLLKHSMKMKSLKKTTKKEILSLFVSFDPNSSFSFLGMKELNWIITILISMILFYKFWIIPTRLICLKETLVKNLSQQFAIALKTKKDGTSPFFISMFFLFVLTNFMGLFPNIFTSSSHITFNSIISFSMWMGFFLFGWVTYTNKMLAHLVPLSTPKPLISFMVLIELISTMIRPGTLGIRLMANMVSGHLLLTLMGNSMVCSPILLLIILVLAQSVLTLLEMGVSMIQAYVFCMLLSLYSDDSDYQG